MPGLGEILIILAVGAVAFYFVRLALRAREGRERVFSRDEPTSETELLRELHQGMMKMEKRIDALETLLLDREEARRAAAGEKRP